MTRAHMGWLLAIVLLVLARLCFFVVDERESVVVTRFGNPYRVIAQSGLNFKLPPPIDEVKRFDRRVLLVSLKPGEFFTKDKKNLVVEPYLLYKIDDPRKFLETLTDESRARERLADLIASELGGVLGTNSLDSILNTDPKLVKMDEISGRITQNVDAVASNDYGIKVLDVRIRRFSFPVQNEQSIFERMRAERGRIANQYRSEGKAEAQKIRADADKRKSEILAETYRKAQIIRGSGEALASRIYAQAYMRDPEFYKFLRSLEAYQKFLKDKSTYVMSSENALLRLFFRGVDEKEDVLRHGR
jgi:membrane protease subunit HflC